ncbi:hypothetical protein MMC17_004709 [Xylographa soralifera]|nr:hypothetical protein [Xylographa soralifera]
MQRRDSFAQRTRKRFTNAYERLRRRHTTSQGLLQDQQQQDQKQPEQQQPGQQQNWQQHDEQEQDRRRQRQRQVQELRDDPEREHFAVENDVTQSTNIQTHRNTGTQTSQAPNYRNASAQTELIAAYHDTGTQTEHLSKPSDARTQTEGLPVDQTPDDTIEGIGHSGPAVAFDPAITGTIQLEAEQRPGRVVVVADSTTNLPILLLTHRLVYLMNQIRSKGQLVDILAENTPIIVQEVIARRQTITNLEAELEREDISAEQRALLEQKKADAETALDEPRKKLFRIDEDQEREKRDLVFVREEFLNTIEQALSDAEFLDPILEKSNTINTEEQLPGFEAQAPEIYQASEPNINGSAESGSQEEVRVALKTLEDAQEFLEQTQEQFDERGNMYHTDVEEYRQALEAGETSITTTTFDLAYYQNVSRLTGCLREAEEYHENALKEARRLGLVVTEDHERSYLASWSSDGYRMSQEAELQGTAPVDKIIRWREQASITSNLEAADLGAQQTPPEQPDTNEFDEWDAKTIGTAESWDAQERKQRLEAIDTNLNPFYRKRIDRWREEMDQLRIKSHPSPKSSDVSN